MTFSRTMVSRRVWREGSRRLRYAPSLPPSAARGMRPPGGWLNRVEAGARAISAKGRGDGESLWRFGRLRPPRGAAKKSSRTAVAWFDLRLFALAQVAVRAISQIGESGGLLAYLSHADLNPAPTIGSTVVLGPERLREERMRNFVAGVALVALFA